MLGAQSIALGMAGSVAAGGMESMSNAPYYLPSMRKGAGYGNQTVLDSILHDGLTCGKYKVHMGECTEETVKKYNISREEQDAYAIESYKRASNAVSSGRFKAEIAPVTIDLGRKGTVTVSEDEEYTKVDFSKVPSLKPVFHSSGTITAANASTLNDGASAVILAHASTSVKPLARILAMADAECDPKFFTIAPSLAVPKCLEMAGLETGDVDLWEINEAFSAVALANIKLLGLDPAKVNVFGGAVSLGHPIGSSGCRLLVTLLHQLQKGQKGCVAICNGGGGASAMIIERL
jgi:acetyl-CoA C-acetyltransferase